MGWPALRGMGDTRQVARHRAEELDLAGGMRLPSAAWPAGAATTR